MSATPYRPVTWGDNDPLFTDKLNAMTNNDQWLFENMPTMFYNAYNLKRTTGLKMASGLVIIPASRSYWGAAVVYFGDFFSQGCHPVVTTGLIHQGQLRMHVGVRGISTMHPDNRGFTASVCVNEATAVNNYITKYVYVTWMAMGY